MNFLSVLIPFLLSASLMAIAFYIMRAVHKKRHPTEDDVKETNRRRREREKLKQDTMQKVSNRLAGKDGDTEHKPNGLRSGKYKKKKKK